MQSVHPKAFADGLQNLTANLGTSRDKAAGTAYVLSLLGPQVLQDLFRDSWVARKGVTIPALDSCRQWRDWQAEPGQITALEAEERRLNLQGKVLAARTAARLFGGAALLIGDGASDPTKPLNPETIRKGGLRYVTVLHRRHLAQGEIETDPASPWFGLPKSWTVNPGGAASQPVHPSRLVFFRGAEVPDPAIGHGEPAWGDSVLLAALAAVNNYNATTANTASLVFEAKVDTIGIPMLMQKLSEPGFETDLLRRLALAETGKGINGTLIHDTEEELGQKQASFSGLPELLDRFSLAACAAFDIPATRFMGMSPAGLSATGESDLRNYYDGIKAQQSLEMQPAMALLDECLIRSALGARPKEVHFNWGSLWQVSAKERAEIGKMNAETIKTMRETGLIADEPLAEAAVNLMTETGAMPGLEGAVNSYIEGSGDDAEDEPDAPKPDAEEEVKPTKDAAPRTLYVRRNVLNAAEIIAWAKGQGFETTLPADDMHVTIAFSRAPVDWMEMGQAWEDDLTIGEGGPRLLEAFGEAKVLLFASSHLSWRHEEMKQAGASWDHAQYQPHITLTYGAAPDLSTVEPYRGEIKLGPEIFEEVKEDWASGIKEA